MRKLFLSMQSTQSSKILVAFFLLSTTIFALSACEDKGAAETAGERIDQGFESASDAYKEGVEEVKDKIDDYS
jgi:hypothetical protein